MPRSTRLIKGFDYVRNRPVEDTLDGWREVLEKIVKGGGRVRKEQGETFGHGRDALLQVEIYENIRIKENSDE